jgi:phage terminase small subunit
MLEEVKAHMPDVVYRRARHCIGEDRRTLATVQALKSSDYEKVGTYRILYGPLRQTVSQVWKDFPCRSRR